MCFTSEDFAPVESNNGWRLEIGHDSAELTFDLELATISLPPSLCLLPSLPEDLRTTPRV